jgi:hypothetical protein
VSNSAAAGHILRSGSLCYVRRVNRDAGQNKPLHLDHPQFEGFEVRQTVRRGQDAVA